MKKKNRLCRKCLHYSEGFCVISGKATCLAGDCPRYEVDKVCRTCEHWIAFNGTDGVCKSGIEFRFSDAKDSCGSWEGEQQWKEKKGLKGKAIGSAHAEDLRKHA
jgi:hypothetical protein